MTTCPQVGRGSCAGLIYRRSIRLCPYSAATFKREAGRGRKLYPIVHVTFSRPPTRELEKSWAKKHRDNIRRQRHRLQKIGQLSLELLDDPGEIHDWLPEFFKVYSHKWHSEGLSSQFDDVRMRIYYQELAKQFLSKGLHVSSLKLDDRRIAYNFCFLHEGWFYGYTSTYRKEYHSYSPGLVNISMLMEYGCINKWMGLDFLQGHESYKNQWTSNGLTCVTFNVGINSGGFPYKWVADYEPELRKRFGTSYTRLRFVLKGSKWI